MKQARQNTTQYANGSALSSRCPFLCNGLCETDNHHKGSANLFGGGLMDMERKYPTREVDGVDVPQMGIKELIKQLGSALETMEGNRKSYTLWSLFSAILCTTCVCLTRASARSRPHRTPCLKSSCSRPIRSAGFAEVRKGRVTRGGEGTFPRKGSFSPPPALPHLIFQRLSTGGEAARRGFRCAAFCIQR